MVTEIVRSTVYIFLIWGPSDMEKEKQVNEVIKETKYKNKTITITV
jgi:hypothetical protein